MLAPLAALLAAAVGAAQAGPVATPATPATVTVRAAPPPPGSDGSPQPVLELELGPGTRGAGEAILRVFLDMPGADAGTPLANPGYVGSVSALGGDGRGWAGQRFALPLAETLARLAARLGGEPSPPDAPTVTVVPVPLRDGAASEIAVEVAAADVVWR
ncbi:MAG TPA: hypothetical protein VFY87_32045 [Geminicoccaceae bacterium]|nr:hypothetical protein [Geminicoccaceae bacterium]